jgi:cystathionine gamma-lyase/cystathionine gamma-lyase/homocysteine desulfhydrase
MVAQPYTGSHASLDEVMKAEMGLNKGLVRLCFGLESLASLKADIFQAIEKINCTLSKDPSTTTSNLVNNERLI